MAVSTGAAILGASALSAGTSAASGLMGSSASGAAKSNAEDMGVANNLMFDTLMRSGTQTLHDSRNATISALNNARGDSYLSLVDYLNRTDPTYGYWDRAQEQGQGYYNSALDTWDNTLKQVRADNQSYLNLGEQGAAGYSGLLTNPSSITSDPGYQFQLSQGAQTLDRSAAAKGKLFSGGAQAAQQQYGQNYASTYLDNVLARYRGAIDVGQKAVSEVDNAGLATASGKSSIYSQLAGLATQTAAAKSAIGQNQGTAYMNTGNALANLNTQIGSANQKSGEDIASYWTQLAKNWSGSESSSVNQENNASMNQSNALAKGLSGVGNAINSGIGSYYGSQLYGGGDTFSKMNLNPSQNALAALYSSPR